MFMEKTRGYHCIQKHVYAKGIEDSEPKRALKLYRKRDKGEGKC